MTGTGFRLPGEAQMIDRILSTFARCFFEDNAGDSRYCPFSCEDAVFILSFSIIMLNTDLHKHGKGNTKNKKMMSRDEYVKNLKGAQDGDEISKEYLHSVYDSILARPIAIDNSIVGAKEDVHSRESVDNFLNNERVADSLLRGLAVHRLDFATVDDYKRCMAYARHDALYDLVRSCVASTWHQWYALVNTGLDIVHLEPQGFDSLLNILLYAMAVCICLELTTELSAFLDQLGRLKSFLETQQGKWGIPKSTHSFRDAPWYVTALRASEAAIAGSKLQGLRIIHQEITNMRSSLLGIVQTKAGMLEAVEQLKDSQYLYQNPRRSFRKSGKLLKRSTRTGRTSHCWLFLFSDLLLYAKRNDSGDLEIHEEYLVHLIKIVDWFPPSQGGRSNQFEVHHPSKSFQVICSSEEEKKAWVEAIRAVCP